MVRTYIENEKIKKIVKRSMDLGLVFISGLTLVPICIFLFLLIILEQLIRGEIGPLIISEPRISKGSMALVGYRTVQRKWLNSKRHG